MTAAGAAHLDVYGPDIAAAIGKPFAASPQTLGMRFEPRDPAPPRRPRKKPQREMQYRQLEPRAETHRLHAGIAFGKELEVRHVAIREPTRADRRRVPMSSQPLPSVGRLPHAAIPYAELSSDVTCHRRHRRDAARRAIARCDAEVDRIERIELMGERVDHGARQSRNAARAADD